MAKPSIALRIYMKDWKELKKYFPPYENERVVDYLTRLSKKIKEIENETKT